jgi:two-component sensor histidine kinase/CHASE1-domain containing sensor protein
VDRIVTARIRAQRWYVRYPRAVPVAIFVAVFTIAALGAFGIERVNAERTRSQVRAAAQDISAALERRAFSHVAYLRAGAMLLSASKRMTPEGFHELAAGMADDDENRGIAGITWAPRVAVGDIAAFEAARRGEGLTGYTVHPAPAAGRDFVVPVTYVSNMGTRPSVALGFDMASEPQRQAAMERAAHDHRPIASGKVALVNRVPGTNWSGFLIYMPVYARAAAGARLLGFVCAPFNAQAFLDSALAMVPSRGLGVSLYDGTIGNGAGSPDRLLAQVTGSPDPDLIVTRTLTIAGRPLVLVVTGRGHDLPTNLSVVTLLFALLVATLLTLLAHVVTRHAQEDLASLEWLEEQISIRNTLTRELNHRVKNTLANVLSIIALTRRRATGLEQFAESLTGRIMALSATHDILTSLSWEPAPLRAVIAAELAPYTEGRDHVISVHGPEVSLAPNDALSLGLAVHELATNASKYGALSVLSGQVAVNWEMITPDLARVIWQENGGPPVPQQRRRGFGTDLVEKIVAHELGHSVDLRFDPEGVRCTLVVPVRLPVAFRMRAGRLNRL